MWFPLPNSFFISQGEWAVVTGASEGIGSAYAFALAERGMHVVIISRSKEKLDKVAKTIGDSTGKNTKVIVADFTKDDVFKCIEDELKDMDIGVLVNNVGILPSAIPSRFSTPQNLDTVITKIINCNVKTMAKMCRIILPGMVHRRRGVVINISSGVASVPFPLYTLYSASKIFVERFSQALQVEYKKKGIVIQAVAPFSISTRMTLYQETNAIVLSPEDFVNTSLQYLRAGDKTYGSVTHTMMGWLLRNIPSRLLSTKSWQKSLKDSVGKALKKS
uniref:Uncharacterized protein n=1 Tax=Knipowitschia caucasica TaxID=637954 RepID=A0AAV2MQH8_KNICA